MTEEYAPIEKEFRKYGDDFKQEFRDGEYAIYSRTSEGREKPSYEVIILRPQKETVSFGRVFPAKEAYPTSSQWGTFGWTIPDSMEAAMSRLRAEQHKRKPVGKAVRVRTRKAKP